MQKCQCPIYNATLKTSSSSKCVKYCRFSDLKIVSSDNFFITFYKERNVQVTYAENPLIEINSLKKKKHRFLIYP